MPHTWDACAYRLASLHQLCIVIICVPLKSQTLWDRDKAHLQVRIAIKKDSIDIKNDVGISVGIDAELDKDRECTFSRMLSLLYKVASDDLDLTKNWLFTPAHTRNHVSGKLAWLRQEVMRA